jgi:hypothetical protein
MIRDRVKSAGREDAPSAPVSESKKSLSKTVSNRAVVNPLIRDRETKRSLDGFSALAREAIGEPMKSTPGAAAVPWHPT